MIDRLISNKYEKLPPILKKTFHNIFLVELYFSYYNYDTYEISGLHFTWPSRASVFKGSLTFSISQIEFVQY